MKPEELGEYYESILEKEMRKEGGVYYTPQIIVLMETMRRTVLFGTEMAEAQCNTFRMKILKVAAVVTESVRRIVFSLSNVYSLRDLWFRIYNRLQPGYTAPSG